MRVEPAKPDSRSVTIKKLILSKQPGVEAGLPVASQVSIQAPSGVLPGFVDISPNLTVRVFHPAPKARFDINKSHVTLPH